MSKSARNATALCILLIVFGVVYLLGGAFLLIFSARTPVPDTSGVTTDFAAYGRIFLIVGIVNAACAGGLLYFVRRLAQEAGESQAAPDSE